MTRGVSAAEDAHQVRLVLEDLPRLVAEARQLRGLTLRAAADRAGVAVSWFWKVERGEGNPGLRVVIRILEWIEQDR